MKICVYTALIGQYDGLIEQSVSANAQADFICFTDDPALTSETWEVRVVEPSFLQDPVRSARLIKILGHPSLEDYDVTIWIDASVRLRARPDEIVADWLHADAQFALATHSYRDQLTDEFDEVIRLNYDDRSRVYEQLTDYAIAHPDVLAQRPLWTGIMVRRRSPELAAVMRTWANHVLRYSRRDQLSLLAALDGAEVTAHQLDIDNFTSPFHEWPVIDSRRVVQGKAPAVPRGPVLADLRRAHLRVASLEQELVATNDRTVRLEEQQSATVRRLEEQIVGQSNQLQAVRGVRGAARNLWQSIGRRIAPRRRQDRRP